MCLKLEGLFLLVALHCELVLANFPPGKPNHVILFADTDNIRVRWRSPTETYGKIRKYLVSWAILPNFTDTSSVIYVDGNVKVASIAVGGDVGRLFRVRVRAQNDAGTGQYSVPRYIRVGCGKDITIKPYDNISITSPGFGVHKLKPGVICRWNVTTQDTFKLRITLDTLKISRSHTSRHHCLDSYVNISSYGTVCDINEGTNITINVSHTTILLRTSINESGGGVDLTVTSVPIVPGPPVNISVHAYQHRLVITWQPPVENTLPITSYNIQYSVISLLTVFKVALGPTMRMFSVNTDSFGGQLVKFTIAAVLGQRQGQMSRPYYIRAFSPKHTYLSTIAALIDMSSTTYITIMPVKPTVLSTSKTATNMQLPIIPSQSINLSTSDTKNPIPPTSYMQPKQSRPTTTHRTTEHRQTTTHAQFKQSKHTFVGDDGIPSTTPPTMGSTVRRHLGAASPPIFYPKSLTTIQQYIGGAVQHVRNRTLPRIRYSDTNHRGPEYSPSTSSSKPKTTHRVLIASSPLERNKSISLIRYTVTNKGSQRTKSSKKPEMLQTLNETFVHTKHKTYLPLYGYTSIKNLGNYETATHFNSRNAAQFVLTTMDYTYKVKNNSSTTETTTSGILEEGTSRKLHETSTVLIVVLSGCGTFVLCVTVGVLQCLYRRRRRAKIHSEIITEYSEFRFLPDKEKMKKITGRYSPPHIELHDILSSVSSRKHGIQIFHRKPLASVHGVSAVVGGKLTSRRFSFPLGRSKKMCKSIEKRLAAFSFIEDKKNFKTTIHRSLQHRRTSSY